MGDATEEEISETQQQVGRVLKTLAVGWLSYGLYKVMSGSSACASTLPHLHRSDHCNLACTDTYFISPSLVLVRSKAASNREIGIGRIVRWHSSEAVLPEVVAQGGVEALLNTLPTAQPDTRATVLDLLLLMAPIADARDRLVANDAVSRASASCAAIDDLQSALAKQRCEANTTALAVALGGGTNE